MRNVSLWLNVPCPVLRIGEFCCPKAIRWLLKSFPFRKGWGLLYS